MFDRTITRISNVIQQIEEVLLAASILLMAGSTILNVFCRSVLGFSLAFTEEVSQFCMIVVCFVGLSYAASKGRHIRMTAIYDQLSLPWRKAMMLLITAVTAALLLTLSWYAACYVYTVYELGGVYPALRVPFYVVYAIAPVGLLLGGIQYCLAFVKNLTSQEIYLSLATKDEYDESEQPAAEEA